MNRTKVAQKFGLTVDVLRRLERDGVIPRINECGNEHYQAAVRLYAASRRLAPAHRITTAWQEVGA